MAKSTSKICFYRKCKRTISRESDVKYCRDHAAARVAEIQAELRALKTAYGDDAKPGKETSAA